MSMLGGRNSISSTAGIQGYNVGGTRRHMNPTQQPSSATAHMMSPTFSPHSMYSQPQLDSFRNNGGASLMGEVFPASPYNTVGSLFMSPTVRNAVVTPHSTLAGRRRQVTNVTSSKFNIYDTIYNVELEPKPSALVPKIRTQLYQTVSHHTGKDVLLRRLVNVPITAEECAAINDSLRQYRHPNLAMLTNVYATEEFVMGSTDVIMEYRFIAGSKSLQEAFFSETGRATEGLLWSFACQMVGLLRSFHETLIPVRGVHWSKMLFVESTGRFYFTGLGFMDLVDRKEANHMMLPMLMRQDIQDLGLVLFQLAAGSPSMRPENFNSKQPIPGFSQSFWELIKTFLEGKADAAQLCHALGERMSMEVGHQEGHTDYILSQCNKEMHNGRVMRLLIKLNFVLESFNEAQEYSVDSHHYALRLFNQFLFNQVDEQNRVRVDWGHVYHCLNKLDCGSEDMIQLIGSDASNTILVVCFADLRSMLDSMFEQLQRSQVTGDVEQYMASPSSLV